MREISVFHPGQSASAASFLLYHHALQCLETAASFSFPHSFIQWENQTRVWLYFSSFLPLTLISDFITCIKQKCYPINVTNEKCISEETNTFSSIKCHSHLCCKKWWSTSIWNEELMEGRPNVFGSEEVLFSHSIILYITGELHESTKYECISPAESNPHCYIRVHFTSRTFMHLSQFPWHAFKFAELNP